MGLYKCGVEVQADYPLMRIANSSIVTKDLGFGIEIIAHIQIKKV
jgi:hypothetical protein